MKNEFHPNESQDDSEPVVEVDQLFQEAIDEEEQLPQTKERECVGGEDEERFLGETKIAGMESTAKSKSADPIATMTISMGVTMVRPSMRTNTRSPT